LLADLFSQILAVKPIGVHDDFFELGGHSLLATQLISRIRDAFQLNDFPLRALFERPTIARLGERIEAERNATAVTARDNILPTPRSAVIPLSSAQQRLWLFDQFEPNNSAYNIPAAVRFRGLLNVVALEQSLSEIIRRHEVLRTHFEGSSEGTTQVISPVSSIAIPVTDLRPSPEEDRAALAVRLIELEVRRPFDLCDGQMLRARILRLDSDENIVVFVMHHIAGDGWSVGLLIDEAVSLYTSFSGGGASGLAELPIQYADYADLQNKWLQSEEADRKLAYWRKQLAGAPALLALPTDFHRPSERSTRGDQQTIIVPRELVDALKELSRSEGATLFMTLLAAFQILLHRYTGQVDIIVGSDIANRNRVELEGLIGFLSNILIFRTDLSGTPDFKEALSRVREIALEAYAHQDVPFEKLVELLQPKRDSSQRVIFQTVFTLQNAHMPEITLPGLRASQIDVHCGTSKFDLVLNLWEQDQGLRGRLEYNTDIFLPSTIERLLRHYLRLLNSIVSHPDVRIGQLEMLSEEESLLLTSATTIQELDQSFSF
jgi:hypothetical protein